MKTIKQKIRHWVMPPMPSDWRLSIAALVFMKWFFLTIIFFVLVGNVVSLLEVSK